MKFEIWVDDGHLDDDVREGVWRPDLQVSMPTAGGLPGSRGKKISWQSQHGSADIIESVNVPSSSAAFGGERSVNNLIQIFEQ